MQQCIIGSCVGTLVNQQHPLCAIGLTLSNYFLFYVQTMHAVWQMSSESAANVLGMGFGDLD
eukprot:17731-Rhodomonas_salina.1